MTGASSLTEIPHIRWQTSARNYPPHCHSDWDTPGQQPAVTSDPMAQDTWLAAVGRNLPKAQATRIEPPVSSLPVDRIRWHWTGALPVGWGTGDQGRSAIFL